MSPDLVCRIVGGRRRNTLDLLRAVQLELGISTKKRAPKSAA